MKNNNHLRDELLRRQRSDCFSKLQNISLCIYLDKKSSEPSSADASERIVVDDDILKKCPGVDKLRADTREKLKNYLQEQVDERNCVYSVDCSFRSS